MEHEWLLNDARAEDTQRSRSIMIELLDAVMEPGRGRDVLAWRIDAKMAHSALLSRATFQDDEWAAQRAKTFVAECTSLLIS